MIHSTITQPLCYFTSHMWQFKAGDSTALVNAYQPRPNLTIQPGFQLSTNLEAKLEVRLLQQHCLSKKPALISFSSQRQKCCPLQFFSFSSLSSWRAVPVWASSFSSELRLIQLVDLVQKWWDPTKKEPK